MRGVEGKRPLTKTYRQLYALGDSRLFVGAENTIPIGARVCLAWRDQSGCSGALIILSSDNANNAFSGRNPVACLLSTVVQLRRAESCDPVPVYRSGSFCSLCLIELYCTWSNRVMSPPGLYGHVYSGYEVLGVKFVVKWVDLDISYA